jgi:hypothetical protein
MFTVQGGVEMCEGGGAGSTVRKIYCTGPWKLMYIKLPMGHGPLIDTALYVMFLMRANPLLGQVGGVWALEI